jgi:DNA-binding transcriptional LysR family regulator
VLRTVVEGQVDLGIIPHAERSEEFEFERLFLYEQVLITPHGHPLLEKPLSSLDEIASWPLVLMGSGTHSRMVLEESFRRRGISYEIVMELDSMDMIKRHVGLGVGISVGPRLAMEPRDENELGLVSLASFLPVDQAGIVTLRGKSLSAPTRNFISVMKDTFAPANARR